jgi:hypothetical protein
VSEFGRGTGIHISVSEDTARFHLELEGEVRTEPGLKASSPATLLEDIR